MRVGDGDSGAAVRAAHAPAWEAVTRRSMTRGVAVEDVVLSWHCPGIVLCIVVSCATRRCPDIEKNDENKITSDELLFTF